ncbi:MAG: phosphotransferase [Gemmatimonadota bacterium]
MTEASLPPESLRQLVDAAAGKQSVSWQRPHTGLSSAERFVVKFSDGSGVFVKAAVDFETGAWLRAEQRMLATLQGTFVPRVITWVEDPGQPVLITEDLSGAYWPADQESVVWRPGQFEILFDTLRTLSGIEAPPWLPAAAPVARSIWRTIEREADQFLALGLCSESWFRQAVDGLIEAEEGLQWTGDSLVHNDVRSDNLCFAGDRLVLVDWGSACRGRPDHDLAAVASTLPLEGGPDPAVLMPNGGQWAAYRAAAASRRAYRSTRAPAWLRVVLRRLATISLAWASATLDLPPWTGTHWSEIV